MDSVWRPAVQHDVIDAFAFDVFFSQASGSRKFGDLCDLENIQPGFRIVEAHL